MEDGKLKRSALMTAYFRGNHAVHDSPIIFDDFLAYQLLKKEEIAAFEQEYVASLRGMDPERAASLPDHAAAIAYLMQNLLLAAAVFSRARYCEDNLKEAIKQGVKQFIILGAGMDTFAFRHPEYLAQIKVIEVDLPATQQFKCSRLAELGWEIPANLHFVPIDFSKEDLATALCKSPFNPQALSFFGWLGVVPYLSRDAIFTTLRSIARICPAGSRIVFDYIDDNVLDPGRAGIRWNLMHEKLRQMGESFQTSLNPYTLASELGAVGLLLEEQVNPVDTQERYFLNRTDNYRALEHAYLSTAVVQ
jgi:methyltransferase (TIGR00027 family)